jgi:hypothetical protein
MPSSQPSHQPIKLPTFPTSYPTMKSTINYPEINNIRIIYAIGTIFVYFKILYFLRPFPSSGPLGKHILYNISFIFILFIYLLFILFYANFIYIYFIYYFQCQ